MNLEEAVTILPPPAALVARDTRRADEVSKALKGLDSQAVNIAFDQGDLFVEVEREAHYATAGFESAPDYYKHLNIDLSPREIQYRTNVSRKTKQLGLRREEFAPAKISKLKLICQLNPSDEITDEDTGVVESVGAIMKRLIKEAPFKKVAEVKAEVEELLGKSGDELDELTWLNLPIRRDAKQIVLDAIELAKAQSGDTLDAVTGEVKDLSDAAALERIAADYLSDPNNQAEQIGEGGDYSDAIAYGDEEAE